jgi:hypothetical protein
MMEEDEATDALTYHDRGDGEQDHVHFRPGLMVWNPLPSPQGKLFAGIMPSTTNFELRGQTVPEIGPNVMEYDLLRAPPTR